MTADHEAAVRAAVDALTTAILAAVKAEAVTDASAPDRLLSIDEAAHSLGIGRSATYDLLGAGRLRSLAIGRRRLVPSGAIRDYIADAEARAAGR